MPANSQIPSAFTIQYESSFDMALQQMATKLRGAVTIRPASGKSLRLNNYGQATMVDITTRGGDTVATDIAVELPWIFPSAAETVHELDEFDAAHLGDVVLPNSDIVMAQAYAVNRKIDDTIVAAATATRYIGENGTTTDAFPSSQQVAVDFEDGSTNTGLTFRKIARAAKIMDENEVPMEDRYLGFGAQQMEDLVADVLANHSNDLASIRMLPGTRVVEQILGFQVIQAQRFLVDGSDIASALAWQKSQLVLGIWDDRKSYIDIRADKRHSTWIRTTINIGAVRRRNEGVVEILCDQSP